MKLSETHLSYLRMFGPQTHGLNLPYSIAKTLEVKGLVEWLPPVFGTQLWGISEKGKKAVKEAERVNV